MHLVILPFVFAGLYAKIKNKKLTRHISLSPASSKPKIRSIETTIKNNTPSNGGTSEKIFFSDTEEVRS